MSAAKKFSESGSPISDGDAAEKALQKANGKGRPTPTRAQAEAARRRPLVPEDRRAAAKQARGKERAQRDVEYQAMRTGDESKLPFRDRGPVKRYMRDFVDARWNVGEYFLFAAFLFLILTFFGRQAPELALASVLAMYLVVLIAIVDGFILWRQLKKRLKAKFSEDALNTRGLAMYAVMRAFQIRRARLPKPQVKHGQYPS